MINCQRMRRDRMHGMSIGLSSLLLIAQAVFSLDHQHTDRQTHAHIQSHRRYWCTTLPMHLLPPAWLALTKQWKLQMPIIRKCFQKVSHNKGNVSNLPCQRMKLADSQCDALMEGWWLTLATTAATTTTCKSYCTQ